MAMAVQFMPDSLQVQEFSRSSSILAITTTAREPYGSVAIQLWDGMEMHTQVDNMRHVIIKTRRMCVVTYFHFIGRQIVPRRLTLPLAQTPQKFH